MDREVVDHLRRMRVLLEKGWTQGAFSRDESGDATYGTGQKPTSWCVLGALYEGSEPPLCVRTRKVLDDAIGPSGYDSIYEWNDAPGRTKTEVIGLMDRVIAAAVAGDVDSDDNAPPTAPVITPERIAELEQDDADTIEALKNLETV